MELDWYCTRVLGMKQQSCWGVLWVFKRPRVSPLEKQRNWQHDIWCLITNTLANRVAIVSSVRYLTLANIGRSRFNPQFCMFSESVFIRIYCQFSVIIHQFFYFHLFLFCFCSIRSVRLFKSFTITYFFSLFVYIKIYWVIGHLVIVCALYIRRD